MTTGTERSLPEAARSTTVVAGPVLPVAEIEQIATAMRRGHRVLVFPAAGGPRESAADPFRRAAFQAAVDAAVVVSPVVVTYHGSSGHPVTMGSPVNRATLIASLIRTLAHRNTADVNWLPVIPAIVDGGHPAGDRARAAAAAQRGGHRSSVATTGGRPIFGQERRCRRGRRPAIRT